MKRQRDIASYFGKKKVLPEPQSDCEHLSFDFENDGSSRTLTEKVATRVNNQHCMPRQQSKPSTVVLRS